MQLVPPRSPVSGSPRISPSTAPETYAARISGPVRSSLDHRPLDSYEQVPSSARFSPLCQCVLQREALAVHRRAPQALLPIGEHQLFSKASRQNVERLLAAGFLPPMLAPIRALASGEELLAVLARQSKPMQQLYYPPDILAGIVYCAAAFDQEEPEDIEHRFDSFRLANLTLRAFATLRQAKHGARVLELIDVHAHRMRLLGLEMHLLVAAGQHTQVRIELEALFVAWDRRMGHGFDELAIADSLSLEPLAMAAAAVQARYDEFAFEQGRTYVSYESYVSACEERVDSATNSA